MFNPRDHGERETGGPATGIAGLTRAQVIPASFGSRLAPPPPPRPTTRQWLAAARTADWTADLAEDIGSGRWIRGLATMLALAILAFAFWPDFSALQAAPIMRVDAGARDEYRSQMIMPLAFGADSGRRMAPGAAVVPLAAAPERATLSLTATLGQGDNFGRMLERAGVGAGDAARVTALVAQVLPLGEIVPGTRFDVTLGTRGGTGGRADAARPLTALAFRARFDLDLAVERSSGTLALVRRPISVDTTPLRIRGVVGESLFMSARAAGAPMKTIQQYLQTLDQHLSLDSEIRPGDTFDMVVGYKRAGTGESQTGELLYAGLERAAKPYAQLLRWGDSGNFYEASGIGEMRSGLVAPVAGRITSSFGMRFHPILGYSRLHAGVDFGAAYGSPIYAVSDGTVSFAGWHGGHGNYVRLEHGGGLSTGYGHMSRIATSPGQTVRQGQVIGYVGSTGLSTGPHLHYETYLGGRPVDPMGVRFASHAQVEGPELAAFKARLAVLQRVVPGAALGSAAPRQAVLSGN